MQSLLKFFKQLFWTEKDWQEQYLGNATDHADLERRIKQLDRGEIKIGPFGTYKQYRYF